MFHILAPNPEAFRDLQYDWHQGSIDDEPTYELCVACLCTIPMNEEVHLVGRKYCCEDCLIYEMEQGELDRDEAIGVLRKYAMQ